MKNPFKRLRMMLREIDNYYFFIRQMEILADTGELRHYKLKMNEKHGIYGAINLPPELLLYNRGEELEQLEKTFFGNEMAKFNDVMMKLDVIELYKVDYERLKTEDYYAYVFCISYKWRLCNRTSITTSIVLFILTILSIYGIISYFV